MSKPIGINIPYLTLAGGGIAYGVAVGISIFGDKAFDNGIGPLISSYVFAGAFGYFSAEIVKRKYKHNAVKAVSLLTAGATIFDGLAICFFPKLYGINGLALTQAATFLLFGVGVGLFFSVVFDENE